jgi:hypothetical protein
VVRGGIRSGPVTVHPEDEGQPGGGRDADDEDNRRPWGVNWCAAGASHFCS